MNVSLETINTNSASHTQQRMYYLKRKCLKKFRMAKEEALQAQGGTLLQDYSLPEDDIYELASEWVDIDITDFVTKGGKISRTTGSSPYCVSSYNVIKAYFTRWKSLGESAEFPPLQPRNKSFTNMVKSYNYLETQLPVQMQNPVQNLQFAQQFAQFQQAQFQQALQSPGFGGGARRNIKPKKERSSDDEEEDEYEEEEEGATCYDQNKKKKAKTSLFDICQRLEHDCSNARSMEDLRAVFDKIPQVKPKDDPGKLVESLWSKYRAAWTRIEKKPGFFVDGKRLRWRGKLPSLDEMTQKDKDRVLDHHMPVQEFMKEDTKTRVLQNWLQAEAAERGETVEGEKPEGDKQEVGGEN